MKNLALESNLFPLEICLDILGRQLSEFVPGSFGFHVVFQNCKLKVTQQKGMNPGAGFDWVRIMSQPKVSWEVSVVFIMCYNLGLEKNLKKMLSMDHRGQE